MKKVVDTIGVHSVHLSASRNDIVLYMKGESQYTCCYKILLSDFLAVSSFANHLKSRRPVSRQTEKSLTIHAAAQSRAVNAQRACWALCLLFLSLASSFRRSLSACSDIVHQTWPSSARARMGCRLCQNA